MTFVVPFDGSELSEAALVRAGEYAAALDEDVVAVSVVPEGKEYAREKGWLDPDEAFDVRAVVRGLHRQVTDLVPEASFRYERVGRFAGAGRVATTIRDLARAEDASVVFLGSANAGRILTPVTSVGRRVAADEGFDLYVVRHRAPPTVERLHPRSDFYLPE